MPGHGIDKQAMEDHPDEKQGRSRKQGEHEGKPDTAKKSVGPQPCKTKVGKVHAQHHEFALGKIDDAHDAKNDGQAHTQRPYMEPISNPATRDCRKFSRYWRPSI